MKTVRLPLFATVAVLCVVLAVGIFTRMGCAQPLNNLVTPVAEGKTGEATKAVAGKDSAAEGLWQTDFKAAQAKAKQEKKYLLVDFTGSDWCGWCIKLHNEVFDKESFKTEAPKQFVLVELDFPHQKKLSPELKKQNEGLSEKYKVEGFPTVILMDAEGEVVARTGYRDGGPEPYLKQLAEFPKIYQNVLALKARIEKTKGLDRAKLLDEIVQGYDKLGNESDETAAWGKEIIALDPDNKAGLRVKYEFPLNLKEAEHLLRDGKIAEAKTVLDKALALKGVAAEMRQEGYILKFQIAMSEKKFVEVVATLKAAKEAAPDSPHVKQIDSMIAQFSKVAEAQDAADKLEAGLAKSEGIDRAKLLDKLVEAKMKLVRFDPEAGENISKWTKEIIALDTDNKAGLKKKYQFKAALSDAIELMQADKVDEANVTLDKALKTAGISAQDVQDGELMKAQIALQQRNEAQGVAHLKKALEAAPEGERAPVIKMLLQRFDRPKTPAKSAE